MRTVVLCLALTCALTQTVNLAAQVPPLRVNPSAGSHQAVRPVPIGTLTAAIEREATRFARAQGDPQRSSRPTVAERRDWISRHPALFGALVGAGGGALLSVTLENELFCSGGDEDCLIHGGGRVVIGAGMGAGVGSLTGFIVGLRK